MRSCVSISNSHQHSLMADVARTRAYYTRSALGSNAAMERSRARRRRRLLMRRGAADAVVDGGDHDALLDSDEDASDPAEATAVVPPPSVLGDGGSLVPERVPPPPERRGTRSFVPVAGAVAVAGRQREMEDAVTIWTNLCSPVVNGSLPVHFFAVYDGHGGSHFSTMCKQKMHEILKEELMGVAAGTTQIGAAGPWGQPTPPPGPITDETHLQETWRVLINRVFARTEMVALHTCGCGSVEFRCSCERSSISYSGTTAVAVIVTEKHYVVGNCGDSRAVLYRGGRIIPLSFDHKPSRADEKARIEASGGRVVNTDTARVQGILAMSRAIGDVFLKPYVISEPEVRFISREEEDEFVIVASDGMWDVITNEMAGRVVHQCLREPIATLADEGPSTAPTVFPSRSSSAASLLTRLALARNSADNISVVVVDLKRPGMN